MDIMDNYEIIEEKVELNADTDDIKSVCENCGCKIEEHSIATKLCPNKFSHFKKKIIL
jgi:transcription initiation factor TFIIIB Brf1 subunit/transcription initiation factor TFIIB